MAKSRVEEVMDEHGNVFKGVDVPLAFVDHFQKFFNIKDEIFPIDDAGILFSKKLDPDIALSLIKEVSDEEIKIALFDIEDDKASGPDGYTSKFFKAA